MENIKVVADSHELAEMAARQAIEILKRAIMVHGNAVWVLAGGTLPPIAYRFITEQLLDELDWSKVTFVMGDERVGPLDSLDNNWHAAEQALLQYIPQATFLRPQSDRSAEDGAGEYQKRITSLVKTEQALPRFDLVWLGMGEDGHTLSLFPGHSGLTPTDQLVIPIHDSPKPPADRITLTFHAIQGAQECVILAAGTNKAAIIRNIKNGVILPIVTAARTAKHTTWLLDEAAISSQS